LLRLSEASSIGTTVPHGRGNSLGQDKNYIEKVIQKFYNILEKNMIPFSEIGLAPIIYRFYNILEKNMIPVYDSARRQGYEIWDYS